MGESLHKKLTNCFPKLNIHLTHEPTILNINSREMKTYIQTKPVCKSLWQFIHNHQTLKTQMSINW